MTISADQKRELFARLDKITAHLDPREGECFKKVAWEVELLLKKLTEELLADGFPPPTIDRAKEAAMAVVLQNETYLNELRWGKQS